MATTKEQQIAALYNELKRSSSNNNDEESLEICDKLIKLNPDDETALHCKVVTQIRLGKYTDALSLISRKLKNKSVDLSFERIYCLYRTNQFQDALDLLNQVKQTRGDDTSLLLLEAQMLYAQDKFKEAIDVYEALLAKTSKDDRLYEEINVNLLAAKAGLAFELSEKDKGKKPTVDVNQKVASSQYEIAYNAATLHIARSELDEARKQLEIARKMCHDKLTEADTPQEEIDEELAVIATQLAYAYQSKGRVDEAMEIYQSVLASGVRDASVNAVVSNNIVAVHQRKDLFDSAKKLKTATGKEANARLKRYQKRVIAMNEALLQLYMNKSTACKDMVEKLIKQYPENETLYLISASATYQQQKAEAAIAELTKYAKQHPQWLAIRFATIQLQLLQSKPAAALETLQSYLETVGEDNRREIYRPALVALLVWLYEQTGQSQKAMETLEQASTFWKTDKDLAAQAPTSIFKQTAAFKLKAGRYREAVADYEEFVKANPTDLQALAGLIVAYTEVDLTKAEQYGNALPAISLNHLDIDNLERVVPGVKKGYVRKEANRHEVMKPKTKKKRKPLLPKSYDPSKTPDPERWIPKRDRSTYREKGKNKKAAGKGPQGSYVAGGGIGGTGSANIAGAKLNKPVATEAAEPEQVEKPAPEAAKPTPPSASKNAAKNKKKKKGKGKW